jgi:NADH:ubiquinone oxidoreductase subunit D
MTIDEKASAIQETIESPEKTATQEMLLNMGPQHPGTHCILRLLLILEGEIIVGCTPIIGYLLMGIEKILVLSNCSLPSALIADPIHKRFHS